jgi:uncharacterized protein YkwD
MLIAAAITAVTACGIRPSEAWSSQPAPPGSADTARHEIPSESELEIAAKVNEEASRTRRAQGLDALTVNEKMNRAAQDYAFELANRGELDHESKTRGREDPGARLEAAGVKWSRVGENLALFSPRVGIASHTIDGWLNSPPHRHNLLNPLYTMTGAGVARDLRGTYYIVQMYATE